MKMQYSKVSWEIIIIPRQKKHSEGKPPIIPFLDKRFLYALLS